MVKSTAQLSLGISSHNNNHLFSDHYLNTILKEDPRWQNVIPDSDAFLAWATELHEQHAAQLDHYSEAQLENHWFQPILRQLGHVFEGQAAVPGLAEGIKYPDYVLFPDEAARQQAVAAQKTSDYARQALAVAEVKAWDVPLGKKRKGAPTFDNNNPSFQIDYYLRATELPWGILSNGRLWRLVYQDSSYKLDVYFEIDLEQTILNQNRAAAAFFVLFFRQAAFLAGDRGRVFLQDALQQSAHYAVALEKDLRDNAYRALEHLIQGFIEPQANGLSADDLPQIYTNSLYLLYRIIFLFYGESRGLLPIENPDYQERSLTKLARDIAGVLDSGQRVPPMTSQYWHRLKSLFSIINGDQPDLNQYLGIPRYNGGLFKPDLHPFLENHFVGDRYLLAAVDVLARREVGERKEERRKENVDYRTLGVRQLGSIYEGLLEYRPRRATEPMVAVKRRNSEEWLPASQKPRRAKVIDERDVGDVYLVTDKGERKATGSYYTPDYIVKYIVEETLDPLVEEARQQVKAEEARKQAGEAAAQAEGQRFADEILKLNVLDPAMGSGHFLVEATDFLARAIATDAYVTVEEEEDIPDDDLVYWRRQVVEACIYGVDKNPMAVELAKLSLWLVTVAREKPLSFLDHHLRHGDSLVGARLTDLDALPAHQQSQDDEQPPLFDESAFTQDAFRAVGGMMAIETMLSDSIEDIQAKETVLAQIDAHLDKWRTIADLWTSSFFGNEMAPEEYADLLRHLQGGEAMMSTDQRRQYLDHSAVTDNDYFHWQLEFPEVYFDRHGQHKKENAGFEAIIGNPPYVRQEQLTPYKPNYQNRFKSFSGTADLYLYFYEQGIKQLRRAGRIAYISSGTFAKTNSAKSFRDWLPNHAHIEVLIDFGENQPFEGAEMVRPSIMVMRKGEQSGNFRSMFMDGTTIWRPLDEAMQEHGFLCDANILKQSEWTFQSIAKSNLADKVFSKGIPLEDYFGGNLYNGIKTALNAAFYLDEVTYHNLLEDDPTCASIIKPMLRGADCRPWYQKTGEQWCILIPMGWTKSKFGKGLTEDAAWAKFRELHPSVARHLSPFAKAGRKRLDQGDYWWELRACSYYDIFKEPKIFWNDITKLPRFSWSDEEVYINQKGYVIPQPPAALLAVLQSRVNWFAISQICTPLRLRAGLWQYQVLAQFVSRLPIPEMSASVREKLSELAMQISDLAKSRYQLHAKVRHRIEADLSSEGGKLNTRLTNWWELDFPAFGREVKKSFRRTIPLKERDEWERYLADARHKHGQLTAQIVAHEVELNNEVYALFNLTPEEIQIIEESTKYSYGEV